MKRLRTLRAGRPALEGRTMAARHRALRDHDVRTSRDNAHGFRDGRHRGHHTRARRVRRGHQRRRVPHTDAQHGHLLIEGDLELLRQARRGEPDVNGTGPSRMAEPRHRFGGRATPAIYR
jgi:hypothetical protein